MFRKIEVWLSLVERCVRDAEAVGSSPVTSTKLKLGGEYPFIRMFTLQALLFPLSVLFTAKM